MLWFFFLLSLVALSSVVLLRLREIGPQGHGIEKVRPKPGATAAPEATPPGRFRV